MQKICPCNSCGQTAMCVSHDNQRFYCNRCLPHFARQKMYWKQEQPPKQEVLSAKESTTSSKKTSSKSKAKKSSSNKKSSTKK